MYQTDYRSTEHRAVHFELTTDQSFDVLTYKYEASVPPIGEHRLEQFVTSNAPWSDVIADAAASAPLGFFVFWRLDVTPTIKLNGYTARCTTYLMGNHVQAERMFRVDPRALFFVPLRVVIYQRDDGPATLMIEQPSVVLKSLGHADVDAVGRHLDIKVAGLLRALDLMLPPELQNLPDE